MSLTFDTTALRTAAELKGKAEAFKRGVQNGIERMADVGEKQSEKRIARIYAKRIPTRAEVAAFRRRSKYGRKRVGKNSVRLASNAPAWKRSGDTQTGLDTDIKPGEARVFIGGAAAEYATAGSRSRHGLGVDWKPKAPALGVIRKNPFFTESGEITATQLGAVFTEEIKNALDE